MKSFQNLTLDEKFLIGDPNQEATRAGFGRGLTKAAEKNEKIVALAADLKDSVGFGDFAKAFPNRFVEVGIAEQNLVCVASGMAHVGQIPFAGSYAAFNPGRNYEQIRTTIALNNQNVKIIGSHAGLNVGPDGGTHQMLEDIALMRAMPNMVVIAPGDSVEAEKVAIEIAKDHRPTYVRLAREKSPIFFNKNHEFKIGRAYILKEGKDITLLSTGTMTAQALIVAAELERKKLSVEVIHVPTVKPLDETTILQSVQKTGRAITIEEHQIAGGFGSAVAELLAENLHIVIAQKAFSPGLNPGTAKQSMAKIKTRLPRKTIFPRNDGHLVFKRIGVDDQFGQSGTAEELLEYYGLTAKNIVKTVREIMSK